MADAVVDIHETHRLADSTGEAVRFHKSEVRRHRRLAQESAREHADYIAKLDAVGIKYVEGTAKEGHSHDNEPRHRD